MKPCNWRRYFGYTPKRTETVSSRLDIHQRAHAYIRWLAETRGLSILEAEKYAYKQKSCGLISASWANDEPAPKVKKPSCKKVLQQALAAMERGDYAYAHEIVKAAA